MPAKLTYEQRIRAMYRKYHPRQAHEADGAMEAYNGDLQQCLEDLVREWGKEPPLQFSSDLLFPTLTPSRSPQQGRAERSTVRGMMHGKSPSSLQELLDKTVLDRIWALGGDDEANESFLSGDKRRKKAKPAPKGEIDLRLQREGVGAEEHKGRAALQDEARRFFTRERLRFSDQRHQIQKREHSIALREAVEEEQRQERKRLRDAERRRQELEHKMLCTTEIMNVVASEDAGRRAIFHELTDEYQKIRRKARKSLQRCQLIMIERSREAAEKRRRQLNGFDNDEFLELCTPRARSPTDSERARGRTKKVPVAEDPTVRKMRRLSTLNQEQRMIISRRMASRYHRRGEEQRAAEAAAKDVAAMLQKVNATRTLPARRKPNAAAAVDSPRQLRSETAPL